MFGLQGFPIFQYTAMITGSLNVICAGMLYGWSSVSLPKLNQPDSVPFVSNDQGSWIAVMIFIGCLIGSTFTAFYVDKFGRKLLLLISSALLFVSWILMAFATNIALLMVSRFVGGLGDGMVCCISPIYFGEISSPNIRGFINGFIFLTLTLGMLIINVMGFYLDLFAISLIASAFSVVSFFTIIWIPESPYYLIMKKSYEEAKISLRKFQCGKNPEEEFARLSAAIESDNSETGKFWDLFTVKSNRKAMYITAGARSLAQMCGATAITFYAETILRESSTNPVIYSYGPMLYFGCMVLTSSVSTIFMDKAGRKLLLLISLIGMCFALIFQSFYFSFKVLTDVNVESYESIPTVGLIVYVISLNIGLQSIPFILAAEFFPTNVKAFAVCLIDVYGNFLAMGVTVVFQSTKDAFGLHLPFYFFLAFSILGCIFVQVVIPETKGKTLEEIQELLKAKN